MEKLHEEVREFEESEEIDEIADILEVLFAIPVHKGFHMEEIQEIRRKKTEEKGEFKKRIILDES